MLGVFFVILLYGFIFREKPILETEITKEESKLNVKNSIALVSNIVVCKYRYPHENMKEIMDDCPNHEDYYIKGVIQEQTKLDEVHNIFDRSYFKELVVDDNVLHTTSLVPEYILLFYNKDEEKIAQSEVYIPLSSDSNMLLSFDTIEEDLIVDKNDINTFLMMLDSKK